MLNEEKIRVCWLTHTDKFVRYTELLEKDAALRVLQQTHRFPQMNGKFWLEGNSAATETPRDNPVKLTRDEEVVLGDMFGVDPLLEMD